MRNSHFYTIFFMMALAAVFGAAVTVLQNTSAGTVARNEALAQQRALVSVFALGDTETLSPTDVAAKVQTCIDETEQRRDPQTGWAFSLLKAYETDQRQTLKGYGFRFRGLGFWAPIHGILAVSPDLKQTLGIVILKQTETPGLGGRIAEPVFTDQFRRGIDITQPSENRQRISISAAPPPADSPQAARHVEAVTGATQTCMAMERILNDHLARFQRAMEERAEPEENR